MAGRGWIGRNSELREPNNRQLSTSYDLLVFAIERISIFELVME
jgi:hypothetical protein